MSRLNKSLAVFFVLASILLINSKAHAVGALFARPRFSSQEYQKMWIKKIDATVNIREQIAVTHVDQTFHNEMNTSVEAIYIFPLPENATMAELVYWVNGQRFVASIRERQQAVNDYNQRLRQWMDPALLEYLGDNLFRLSIVPINADTDVRTEITYVEPLQYDLGVVKYLFQLNTLQLSSKPLQTVSINLDAVSQYPFKKFFSPSHQNSSATRIDKISDNEYKLFYGDENFTPDKDLTVEFETVRDSVHFSVLTYTPVPDDSIGTDSYYAIWITPPDNLGNDDIIPKDIVFTADVSSSMEGLRLNQVKSALNNFLDLLSTKDKFNIVTFGTFVDKFKPDLVPASSENIKAAKDFVFQMYALGMTNIDGALSESLNQSYEDSTSNDLVFLTDGKPTWGKTNTDSILIDASGYNKKGVRIFSFGVGTDVSRSFLTSLANENHGYAKFIASDDSIALVVNDHFQRISKPVMTDIQIDMGGLKAWDQYPKIIGDLFWGSQVTQLGMYNSLGTFNVTLKGKLHSKDFEYNQKINFADTLTGNRFVPRLWAKAKIDDILKLIEIYGETAELVNQVIDLGLKYQIVTPYTALYVDPINPPPTTAVDEDSKSLPDKFILEQNYPNPFNPSTVIGFILPNNRSTYHVAIRIYNSLGQLVCLLLNEDKAPGKYSIAWNGKDSNGNMVPSGIYFYSIQAGDLKQIKKMILMR